MPNTSYIIVGIVIIAVVGGGIFFFTRDDTSTSDASSLQHGTKNLTRDSAAKMIETYLRTTPVIAAVVFGAPKKQFVYNAAIGHHAVGLLKETDPQLKMLRDLHAGGFIKIVSETNSSYSPGAKDISFDFTDQAKPYIVPRENASPDDKNIDVLLADIASVEVTGVTEPAQGAGGNTRTADFIIKYNLTPFGKASGEKEEVSSPIPAVFMLYDDGWRLSPGFWQ